MSSVQKLGKLQGCSLLRETLYSNLLMTLIKLESNL